MKNEENSEPKWQHEAVFENINELKWDKVSVDSVPGTDEPAVLFKNVLKSKM